MSFLPKPVYDTFKVYVSGVSLSVTDHCLVVGGVCLTLYGDGEFSVLNKDE